MDFKLLCLLLLCLWHLTTCFMDAQFALSFLKTKHLKSSVVLTCLTKSSDRTNLSKWLHAHQTALVSVKNFNNVNILTELVKDYHKLGVVVDADCADAHAFLLKCTRYKVFDTKHYWLLLHQSPLYRPLLESVNLNVDCDVKVAYRRAGGRGYAIDDVYNPAHGKGGELVSQLVGTYDPDKGYQIDERTNKYFARKNLTGVRFRSVVVLPEPYKKPLESYLQSDDNFQSNTLNRFHARLMQYCRTYYNFTVQVGAVPSWGFFKPDRTMDGLVGALERKQVDFGSSPLICKKERTELMTFGKNAWPLRMAFMFRNPNSKKSYQIFTKPLSPEVWMCVFLAALSLTVAQKVAFTLDRLLRSKPEDCSWSLSVVCTLGALCQQGTSSYPKSVGGRTATLLVLVLGLLIYQFYSATLVSFLLNVPVNVMSSVQEILDSDFGVGYENVLYSRSLLEAGKDPLVRDVHRRVLVNNESGFLLRDEGMNLVKRGRYAFHVELVTAYPFIEKYFDQGMICELKEIPLFPPMYMYANYQKWSPFKDIMDVCLQRLSENGVVTRELLFWHPRRPRCTRSADTINIHTGLEDFYPALVVWATGVILSLQILGGEMAWCFVTSLRNFN